MFQSVDFLGKTIGMYGVASVIGLFCAFFIIYFPNRKKGLLFDDSLIAGVSALIGLAVGGHLVYGISRMPSLIHFISNDFDKIKSFWDFIMLLVETFGGMVFYGGLYGFLVGLLVYCRITRSNRRFIFNAFAPGLPMFHAFGRIGCVLGGCCYGIEYHGPLHIDYPTSAVIGYANADIADFSRFPVQFLEAGLELLLCIFLLIMLKKFGNKYSLIKIYLFSYSIIRFLDEFLRGDRIRGFWGPLSTSQWISLITIVVISVLFIRNKLRKNKEV